MSAVIDYEAEAKKRNAKIEFRKNIVLGAILRKIHKEQGTMLYLLQIIEPHLSQAQRQLFGI
jgi:hypothetical protein